MTSSLSLDILTGDAIWNGHAINFTRAEIIILFVLARNEGAPVTRAALVDAMPQEPRTEASQIVGNPLTHIRRKIEDHGLPLVVESGDGVVRLSGVMMFRARDVDVLAFSTALADAA